MTHGIPKMFDRMHMKVALVKAVIVLVPSYVAALLTDKMVFVVPTLAAASFLAATLRFDEKQTTQRVDEDGADVDAGNSMVDMIDGSA